MDENLRKIQAGKTIGRYTECQAGFSLVLVEFAFVNSHSHRGFSPVTTHFDKNSKPFQRFTLSLPSKATSNR
jgi:hypothetical protein